MTTSSTTADHGQGAPVPPTDARMILTLHIERGVGMARAAGLNRVAEELIEVAILACPDRERDALARRLSITLAEV